MKLKTGDRVRMTEAFKTLMRGECGLTGKHVGPFDPGMPHTGPKLLQHPDDRGGVDCFGCSSDHIDEFGDCIGLVEDLMDYGTSKGPELNVRWLPSRLRYGYLSEQLELIN